MDATGQFRLRSAATDLTGAATIATVTMTATDEAGFDHFHDPFMHGAALMVDADGAVVYAYADAEVSGHGLPASALRLQYRIALSGAASAGRNFDADTYPILDSSSTNYPTAGLASGGFYVFDGTDLIFKTDDASAEAALSATPSVSGTPLSMNIGPNGTTIQVCHGNGYANFHIFRNNTLIASSVDAFDGTQDISAMFYYGAT